ncbi:MAG: RibD family protein [Cyanobacteria bacterium P01_H01_bin.58]
MGNLRAYTTVVLAMSADGKIADYQRNPARFSSAQDLAHLEKQIAQADAVLFGAGTLRAYGTCLPVRQATLIQQRRDDGRPDQPAQIVCSRSGEFDLGLRFFQQAVPRWLLTTPKGAERWQATSAFEQILLFPDVPTAWHRTLAILRDQGIERLAVLGGGSLVGELVQQDLVDELYLTICPLLLGGATAPTPVDGDGLPVTLPRQLALVQARTEGNEVFLHYRRAPLSVCD